MDLKTNHYEPERKTTILLIPFFRNRYLQNKPIFYCSVTNFMIERNPFFFIHHFLFMLAVRGLIFYKLFQQFFEEQSTSSLALFLKDFQPSGFLETWFTKTLQQLDVFDGGPGKRLQSLLWL